MYLGLDDLVIETAFGVFGTHFEGVLKNKFPQYEGLEQEGREAGVDPKPFLARYVAQRMVIDSSDGWSDMKTLAGTIRQLADP